MNVVVFQWKFFIAKTSCVHSDVDGSERLFPTVLSKASSAQGYRYQSRLSTTNWMMLSKEVLVFQFMEVS